MTDDEVEWVKYFAETTNGFVREWPGALYRRTKVVGRQRLRDAAWTANHKWERTSLFIAHKFGKDDGDVLVVEVPADEAEQIREMIGVRPRGGPFTPEGQAWLAEHPEDRAAKYLGVGPEYKSAHQMVSPVDPTAILARDVPS